MFIDKNEIMHIIFVFFKDYSAKKIIFDCDVEKFF